MTDQTDKKILEILQEDGRITTNDLAKKIGLTTTPTAERVKRLERSGIIEGYTARINKEKVGKGLTLFCSIKLAVHQMQSIYDFSEHIGKIPEILACYNITGEYDYLLQIVVADTGEYEQLLRSKLTRIPGVEQIYTGIVLSVIKEGSNIQLTEVEEGENHG